MEELIPISEHNGKKAVSARTLHAFLGSKTKFNDWFNRRIEEYGFIENQDYEVLLNFEKNPSGGRPLTEYALSIPCAKEIAMVEGNDKGKQARQYFIACEEKLKEAAKPISPAEMLLREAQLMVEHERRLALVENKVDVILQRQEEAENELKALPVSSDSVPEMSLRDKIRLLVNRYSSATGTYQQAVWDKVYQMLYYNYHSSIKSHKKVTKNESWLDVAERIGCLDSIYAILSGLLKDKGIAA
jgi:phage anti-repressor protein